MKNFPAGEFISHIFDFFEKGYFVLIAGMEIVPIPIM